MELHRLQIESKVREALQEDLGLAGDVTSTSTVPESRQGSAEILVKAPGVICGLNVVREVFRQVDASVELSFNAKDGDQFSTRSSIAQIRGSLRSILIAERTALNFLGRMSGIATLTHQYVTSIAGTGAKIVCTRKTTPGLRQFEKYAVRCGGGTNHRFGLFDAVMIKDNHIRAAGSIEHALIAARQKVGHLTKIEIEVEHFDQLEEVLKFGADVILLDNMQPSEIRNCVERVKGQAVLEASGGISIENVREYAETGIDVISIGKLTHSAPNLDVSLEIESK